MADVGKILAKGAGAAALYFVARDAHVNGKIQADIEMKNGGSKAAAYFLDNSMTIDRPSLTKSRMQDWVFRKELSQNIRGFCDSFAGYFKGIGKTIENTLLPLGLGLVALFTKSSKLAKGSALGLLAIGAFSFVKDGLGIGKRNDLKLPTE